MLRRKPVRQLGQELRDIPTYTIPEAARFLAIPARTLFEWFRKPHLLKPSAKTSGIALLSFKDISEAYVLEILRNVYGIGTGQLAAILRNARLETKLKRPLIEADMGVLFGKLIMVKPARGKLPRRDIDLSSNRNLAIPGLVDLAGSRLLRDEKNIPYRLLPWRLMLEDRSSPITVDPNILSGRPVITGTRIPLSLLAGMERSGKTAAQIAKGYNVEVDAIVKALKHLERPVQKVA